MMNKRVSAVSMRMAKVLILNEFLPFVNNTILLHKHSIENKIERKIFHLYRSRGMSKAEMYSSMQG